MHSKGTLHLFFFAKSFPFVCENPHRNWTILLNIYLKSNNIKWVVVSSFSMCNQMVKGEIREWCQALFVRIWTKRKWNYSLISRDIWLLIYIMGDELRSQSWVFDLFIPHGFIVSTENSTLSRIDLSSKFSECFDKIPLRILHDVLCRVFRFSKASFNALTSQFIEF